MELKLIRKIFTENSTIGDIFIDGKFHSNCIEDKDRGLMQSMAVEEVKKIKVFGQTCIPYGKYQVMDTYSPKYKKNVPQIVNVKGFDGIRIHSANQATQLEG